MNYLFFLSKLFLLFRNYFIYLASLLVSLILSPIILPLLLIFKIKFVNIDGSRMGHLCIQFEPYIREEFNKKNNFLIFFNGPTSNKYLLEIYKEFINKNKNLFFLKGEKFWKILIITYKIVFRKNFQIYVNSDKFYNHYHKFKSPFGIIHKDNNTGKSLLANFNIPLNSKIICINNRDEKFLQSRFPQMNFDYHNFRNFKISSMKKAIKYFLDHDYYVVRFGSETNDFLDLDSKNFIDYANSNSRTDFGDIFFNSICDFYFGAPSGSWNISRLFRKPAYLINFTPMRDIFVMRWDYPVIFKKYKYKENNKILSISEILESKVFNFARTDYYLKKNIDIIDNSDDEIFDLAVEAVKINEKREIVYSMEYKDKLKKFHETIFKSNNKIFPYPNPIGEKFLLNTEV